MVMVKEIHIIMVRTEGGDYIQIRDDGEEISRDNLEFLIEKLRDYYNGGTSNG